MILFSIYLNMKVCNPKLTTNCNYDFIKLLNFTFPRHTESARFLNIYEAKEYYTLNKCTGKIINAYAKIHYEI